MTGRRKGSSGRRGRPPQSALRKLRTRVKTAKGRKASSTRWLERQLNDPFVEAAKRAGYRSRAAFKLIGLDEKCGLLKKGARVLDLGAAPGGWTQVAVERAGAGNVFAIDMLPMDPVPGAEILQLDFLDPDAPARIRAMIGGPVDVVLSDMAAPATGHKQTDHLRIMALCEAAFDLAREALAPGGAFCAKVLRGGTEQSLLDELRRDFATVRHVKPEASRPESAEIYVVATGFRGAGM